MNFDQDKLTTVISDASRPDLRRDLPAAGDRFDDLTLARALAIASGDNPYRSRLMAMIGHDLKQPLQLISFILELLGAELADTDQKPRLLLAQDAVRRIADGLDRLVLASKPDHLPPAPVPTTFPISDILLRIAPIWREHAMRGGVRLRVARSSAHVTSDVEMLSTILGNLIGNAIKYAPRGHVLVGCRRIGDRLRIQVIDTGRGIPADRIAALFVPFHQEDPDSAGFGLGLAIAQRSAALLGHKIEVRSVVGKGSQFSVEVPLARQTAAEARDSMPDFADKAFA